MSSSRPGTTIALQQLPDELQQFVTEELNDNESLVWVGQPNPRLYARRALPAAVFGVVLIVVSLGAIAIAQGYLLPEFAADDYSGTVIALAPLLLGLGILTAPYWSRRKARSIAYVITTQRAIIVEGHLLVNIRSFTPDQLTNLRRRQRADGSGDLILERRLTTESWIDSAFECLDDVKAAENLVRELTGRRERRRPSLHG